MDDVEFWDLIKQSDGDEGRLQTLLYGRPREDHPARGRRRAGAPRGAAPPPPARAPAGARPYLSGPAAPPPPRAPRGPGLPHQRRQEPRRVRLLPRLDDNRKTTPLPPPPPS